MNIFEIEKNISDLYENLIDDDGEINEEVVKQIEDLTIAREKKIENTALFVKKTDYEIKALKEEKKRIDSRIRQKTRTQDWLKNLLSGTLMGQKFETPSVRVSFRTSKKVEVDDGFIDYCRAKDLKQFFKAEVTFKPNKVELKKAIQKGLEDEELNKHCKIIESKNVLIR